MVQYRSNEPLDMLHVANADELHVAVTRGAVTITIGSLSELQISRGIVTVSSLNIGYIRAGIRRYLRREAILYNHYPPICYRVNHRR